MIYNTYGSIYIFTNKMNGKQYVGQTVSKNPSRYCQDHFKSARKGVDKYFYNAIRKYGETNFVFNIVGCAEDKQALDLLEDFYIRILRTLHPNGYNLQGGGTKGKPSKITLLKRSHSMTIAHTRLETKLKHAAGILRTKDDPVKKERQRASLNDPIKKAQRIMRLKATFATPESRARKIAASREVANRPEFSANQKARFLDPIFRESHSHATKEGMIDVKDYLSDKMKIVYQSENGRKIQGLRNKNRRWITNGIKDKLIKLNIELPEGWNFGRTYSRGLQRAIPADDPRQVRPGDRGARSIDALVQARATAVDGGDRVMDPSEGR